MRYVYLDEAYESETFWNTKGLHGMIQHNIQTLANRIQIQTWVRPRKEQKTTDMDMLLHGHSIPHCSRMRCQRYLHNNMMGNSHAGQYRSDFLSAR